MAGAARGRLCASLPFPGVCAGTAGCRKRRDFRFIRSTWSNTGQAAGRCYRRLTPRYRQLIADAAASTRMLSEVTSRDQRLYRRSRARVVLRLPTTRSFKRAFARFGHCRYRTRQRGREQMLISRAPKTYTAAKRKIGCDPLCTILTECAGRLRCAEIKPFA
jgi:hypothetical protein